MTRKFLAAALSMMVVLLWAAPAHAYVTSVLHDGFEASPTNWTLEHGGSDYEGEIDYEPTWAHAGAGSAFLGSGGLGGFSSVGRPVTLAITGRTCTLSALFIPYSMDETGRNMVNIEVINPTTWTYIALSTHVFTSSAFWQSASVSWAPSLINIYVRFSVLGSDSGFIMDQIDDMYVTCQT